MIPLFDLHCDTLSRIYKNNWDISCSSLHISPNKARNFSPYFQVCAIWSDKRLTNEEAYSDYKTNLNYIKNKGIDFSLNAKELSLHNRILAIEDARILDNRLSRLADIFNDGVRVLTLNWKDNSCIGGGWNTTSSLTDFGVAVVTECNSLGITIDLSHSSYETQKQVLTISNKPVICSHSNSYTACKHKRNLTDDIFKEIVCQNGIVGISMCPEHLSLEKSADSTDILRHISHYLSLNGENHISLGCDLDGIDSLPIGFSSIKDLTTLYVLLQNEFSKSIADKIFFHNANNFFSKNL